MTTKYVVLEMGNGGEPLHAGASGWFEIAKVDASSARRAIAEALAGESRSKGTFVAVPARSWAPVQVHYDIRPIIRFGGNGQPATEAADNAI